MSDTLRIRLHPKQLQAYRSQSRVIAYIGGIQSGKSVCAGLWMAREVARADEEGNSFLVCSPTYKIQQQSILPWVQRLFKGAGEYKSSDDLYQMNGGSQLYLRSLTDPDSIEGIPNVKAIWVDEAGLISYRAWANVLGRSAFAQAPVFLSTTPYSQNFLYRDIYLPYSKGEIIEPNLTVVLCKSADNPYFPKEELDRQRQILDPRIFRMKYEASFERLVGLVYPDFIPSIEHSLVPNEILNHQHWQFFGGIDIGFADPFVVIILAIERNGPRMVVYREFYRTYMSHQDRIDILRQFHQQYNVVRYYCDSAHPDDIQLFNSAGIPVDGAPKGKNSVSLGIAYITELIRQRRLLAMNERVPHFLDEMSQYAYPENALDAEKDRASENPLHVHSHGPDSLRYLCMSIKHIIDSHQAPERVGIQKTHLQRVLAGEFNKKDPDDWYNQ